MRLHSLHTAQILARAPALAGLARLSSAAHERLDATAARAALDASGLQLRGTAPLPAGLSEHEAQVLGELARGRSNKEIARRLGLSPKTVGHHLERIYAKLQVRTRADATLFAVEQGLLGMA